MSKLVLYFPEDSSELYRIEFFSSLLKESRISVRGKSCGFNSNGSFQWTSSVKALCLLILKVAAGLEDQNLEGGKGSLASSLDFAISKEPLWLSDVFGKDQYDRSITKRIFHRINSELKSPGPVQISFNKGFLSDLSVEVYLGRKLAEKDQLLKHINILNTDKYGEEQNKTSYLLSIVKEGFKSQISSMLSLTDIFSLESRDRMFNNLKNSFVMKKALGSNDFRLKEFDFSFNTNQRLGISKTIPINRRIKVSAPPTLAGGLAIMNALKEKGYNLDINYYSAHAVDIVRNILKEQLEELPDLMVLGVAPASTLLKSKLSKEYIPLMFLPKTAHGVVQHKESSAKSLNNGDFMLMSEDPSLPSFIFDELHSSGAISSSVKAKNLEPDETFVKLGEGDNYGKSILFFPHYHFNIKLNNCSALTVPNPDILFKDVVLMARISSFSEKELFELDIAIRNIWLAMICNPNLMQSAIDKLNSDNNLLDYVIRISGAYKILSRQTQLDFSRYGYD